MRAVTAIDVLSALAKLGSGLDRIEVVVLPVAIMVCTGLKYQNIADIIAAIRNFDHQQDRDDDAN